MNTRSVNSAAGVILAALQQNRTATGIALSLESAGLLMSPEAAADMASVSTDAVVLLDKAVGELKREHELSAELRQALDQSQEDVTGACLARWEEEQDNARLRLALKSAKRGRRELRASLKKRTDLLLSVQALCRQKMAEAKGRKAFGDRLRARVAELEAQREADHKTWQHDLRTARDEREATAVRIAELEAERHSTNEALDDAVQALRADRAEPAKGPTAAESADKLTRLFAPTQALREDERAGVVTPRVQAMRALLDGQRAAVEDPHDGPLHHSYRVPRDLPQLGGAQ